MRQKVQPLLRGRARRLRRDSTDAEQCLWSRLRAGRLDGLKFKRQVPIGQYIADFVCFEARLIVEVDGGQHSESEYDERRDRELSGRSFRVLRFWNHSVLKDTDDVVAMIFAAARPLTPPT